MSEAKQFLIQYTGFHESTVDNSFKWVVAAMEEWRKYLDQAPPQEAVSKDRLDDLMKVRNYFGENSKTNFEQWAYDFMTKLYNSLNPTK